MVLHPTYYNRLHSVVFLFILAGVPFVILNIQHAHHYLPKTEIDFHFSLPNVWTNQQEKATIAYAITVTDCQVGTTLFDGAAVLMHSIQLVSQSSKYGYQFYAFLHPDGQACAPLLSHLGYEVQIRPSPVNLTDIRNRQLQKATKNSCCGIKEMMKLYSYMLPGHPVVVHLDLDTIVLKPLDDLFDLMLQNESFNRSRIPAMWKEPDEFPSQVDFLFTRDYNMVDPPRRQPYQIGVQGGFLIIRPNETDFRRLIEIILDGGNYDIHEGWGGTELGFGGYYGAATVQGLLSYYFGHIDKHRSVELNRCYYNNMVDDPMDTEVAIVQNKTKRCRTLQEACQDCRKMKVEDIYTAHFTICGKPWWCDLSPRTVEKEVFGLCPKLHREWHRVRLSLEDQWKEQYDDYQPIYAHTGPNGLSAETRHYQNYSHGHCRAMQPMGYIRLQLPSSFAAQGETITWQVEPYSTKFSLSNVSQKITSVL